MVVLALTTAVSAHALSLTEALFRARLTDPQFLAAKANVAAARKRADQAFGALLPQVSVSASTTANQRSYQVLDAPLPATEDTYNSNNAQLNITQPLWHLPNKVALTQAHAVAAQANHQLTAADQDLLVRLSQAWLELMFARDVVEFNATQVTATRQQSEQTRRALALGLASSPMLEEALFKFSQAQADFSNAETEQNIKLGALEQIIGPLAPMVPPTLSNSFTPKDPRSLQFSQWLSLAEVTNPGVLAGSSALDAANEEIRKQYAGHHPTLDLVMTYGRNYQAVGSFPGQPGSEVKQQGIGLQLNMPLYSGGTQNAKVAEAMAMRDKATYELEGAKRSARQATTQAWFTWLGGLARQVAAQQLIKFTALSLEAAIKGRATGVKAESDILLARQQWFGAHRDLQKARHDMIISYIKLRATTGQLTDEDLTSLDTWLELNQSQTAQN